jgi:hypothetical protein
VASVSLHLKKLKWKLNSATQIYAYFINVILFAVYIIIGTNDIVYYYYRHHLKTFFFRVLALLLFSIRAGYNFSLIVKLST